MEEKSSSSVRALISGHVTWLPALVLSTTAGGRRNWIPQSGGFFTVHITCNLLNRSRTLSDRWLWSDSTA
jgi:hypothetical protein